MLTGATRFVDVELDQGVSSENYYWLKGPLPGDVGKRIVVLHSNQPPVSRELAKDVLPWEMEKLVISRAQSQNERLYGVLKEENWLYIPEN